MILTRRLVEKIFPEKDALMQWQTQAGNITTKFKVKVNFTLPALNATNVVTWKFHVDDSTRCRYDMILGRDILIELGLNLKYSKHVIKSDDGPFIVSTASMVDLGAYVFKDLNTGKIIPEESFTDAYVEEFYGSDHVSNATKRLRVILDAKYENEDLHKVM